MNTSTGFENIEQLVEILGKWIPREHHREHSGQSLSTTLHSFPNMVGTILKPNNSLESVCIRPKSISISRNSFKGHDPLSNPTILTGSIQVGT
jgi:hypothetical protein